MTEEIKAEKEQEGATVEVEIKGENDTIPTTSTSDTDKDQLLDAVRKQVEYYFSKENLQSDAYLTSQMDASMTVPISVVMKFAKMKALTEDETILRKALETSNLTVIDDRIKANIKAVGRSTIILREIPSDATEEEVKEIFNFDGCKTISSMRSDIGDTWFVMMDSEEDAKDTLIDLKLKKRMFRGQAVKGRLKSETVVRSFYPVQAAPAMPPAGIYPGMPMQFPSAAGFVPTGTMPVDLRYDNYSMGGMSGGGLVTGPGGVPIASNLPDGIPGSGAMSQPGQAGPSLASVSGDEMQSVLGGMNKNDPRLRNNVNNNMINGVNVVMGGINSMGYLQGGINSGVLPASYRVPNGAITAASLVAGGVGMNLSTPGGGLTHIRGGDMNAIAGGRPSKSGTAASGSGLSANARGSTNPNGSKDNTLTGQGRNAGGKNKDGNKGLQSANSQGSSSSGGISSSALGSSSLGNQHNSSNRLTIEINSLNFPPLAGTGDKGTASHAVEDSTKTVLDDMITKVISGTTPPSSSDETGGDNNNNNNNNNYSEMGGGNHSPSTLHDKTHTGCVSTGASTDSNTVGADHTSSGQGLSEGGNPNLGTGPTPTNASTMAAWKTPTGVAGASSWAAMVAANAAATEAATATANGTGGGSTTGGSPRPSTMGGLRGSKDGAAGGSNSPGKDNKGTGAGSGNKPSGNVSSAASSSSSSSGKPRVVGSGGGMSGGNNASMVGDHRNREGDRRRAGGNGGGSGGGSNNGGDGKGDKDRSRQSSSSSSSSTSGSQQQSDHKKGSSTQQGGQGQSDHNREQRRRDNNHSGEESALDSGPSSGEDQGQGLHSASDRPSQSSQPHKDKGSDGEPVEKTATVTSGWGGKPTFANILKQQQAEQANQTSSAPSTASGQGSVSPTTGNGSGATGKGRSSQEGGSSHHQGSNSKLVNGSATTGGSTSRGSGGGDRHHSRGGGAGSGSSGGGSQSQSGTSHESQSQPSGSGQGSKGKTVTATPVGAASLTGMWARETLPILHKDKGPGDKDKEKGADKGDKGSDMAAAPKDKGSDTTTTVPTPSDSTSTSNGPSPVDTTKGHDGPH